MATEIPRTFRPNEMINSLTENKQYQQRLRAYKESRAGPLFKDDEAVRKGITDAGCTFARNFE